MVVFLGFGPSIPPVEGDSSARKLEGDTPHALAKSSRSRRVSLDEILNFGYSNVLGEFMFSDDYCGRAKGGQICFHHTDELVEICDLGELCPIDDNYHFPTAQLARRNLDRALSAVARYNRFKIAGHEGAGNLILERAMAIARKRNFDPYPPPPEIEDAVDGTFTALAKGGFIDCDFTFNARAENGKIKPRVDWGQYDPKKRTLSISPTLKLTQRGELLYDEVESASTLVRQLALLKYNRESIPLIKEDANELRKLIEKFFSTSSGRAGLIIRQTQLLARFLEKNTVINTAYSFGLSRIQEDLGISKREARKFKSFLIDLGILVDTGAEEMRFRFSSRAFELAGGMPLINNAALNLFGIRLSQ